MATAPDRHHRFGIATRASFPGLADYAATKAAIVATARARRATSDRVASPQRVAAGLDRHRHETRRTAASSPKPSGRSTPCNVLAPPKRIAVGVRVPHQPRSVVRDRHRTQCRWRLRRLTRSITARPGTWRSGLRTTLEYPMIELRPFSKTCQRGHGWLKAKHHSRSAAIMTRQLGHGSLAGVERRRDRAEHGLSGPSPRQHGNHHLCP